MRSITRQAISAFNNNQNFSLSNTVVKADCTGTYMFLFGNLIARKINNRVQVTLCGYNTNTIRERLSGLCNIKSKKGQVYINNNPVSSTEWIQL